MPEELDESNQSVVAFMGTGASLRLASPSATSREPCLLPGRSARPASCGRRPGSGDGACALGKTGRDLGLGRGAGVPPGGDEMKTKCESLEVRRKRRQVLSF